MMTLMSDIGAPLLALLAVVGGLFAAWFAGKSKGTASAKVEAAEQRTEDLNAIAADTIHKNQQAIAEQNKTTVQSNDIDEDVARMSDADVLNELHNFGRPPTKDGDNSSEK